MLVLIMTLDLKTKIFRNSCICRKRAQPQQIAKFDKVSLNWPILHFISLRRQLFITYKVQYQGSSIMI